MLQSIRDSLSGWVLWFVVGLIAVPFAFVGIESFRMSGGDPVLVEVGDAEITDSRFRNAFDQRFRQLQQMMGDNFRPEMINTAAFREAVLEDMTQEAVLLQYAQRQGFRGSDGEVFDYIRSLPAFQRDERFSAEAYREILARQGMTPELFEGQLRGALAIDQMRDGVLDSALLPDALLDHNLRLLQQQRSLSTVVIPASRFVSEVVVDDSAIQARYEQNQAQYQLPERVKLDYVMLDAATMEPVPDPEPSVLEALYEAERARFIQAEERRARHILIPLGADAAAARQQAADVRTRLDEGADFAELAAEFSSDTGSKDQGGDLGWVERGQMVPDFEDALFSLEQGAVSTPVTTEFGVHLIRLEEVRAEQVRTLEDEEVRAELLARYHERERALRVQDLQEQLEQIAFENPGSLEPAATQLSLQVQQTDWFSRQGGTGLLAERGVLAAAFSPELLDADENSRPIALSDGRVVVVRKADYEPPRVKPLEDVIGDIRDELIQERAVAAAAALAEQLVGEAARESQPLAALAEQHDLAFRSLGPVGRNDVNVDPDVLTRLFALPRPEDASKPTLSVVTQRNGDVALIAFSGVREADITAADRVAARDNVSQTLAGREFEAYQATMRDVVKVKVKRPLTRDDAP